MRILAIRGSNLASLSGPFELDLRHPPLGDAHLFVITGPVGSGKSTLLDALSVALFHEAPRLVKASKAKFDDLPADDPRNLLRRGATQGFAEVDFQADDGRSYRARWEVRRARRRVDGAVQKPTCSLICLETGDVLGGGLVETRAEISRVIGLDFNQFQRSVLLAQGEFASFLQAGSNERSALLERMTGTELYGRVSKAAYERAKIELERVEAIQKEMAGLQALSVDELVALQEEIRQTNLQLGELDNFLRALTVEQEWFIRNHELEQALEGAKAEQAAVLTQEPVFEEKRRELNRTETALKLSSLLSAVDELARESETLTTGLESQREAARQAVENRAAAQEKVDEARKILEAAESLRREVAPMLEEALKLDEQLRLAEQALSEAENARGAAEERKTRAGESLSSSQDLLAKLQDTAQELEEFKTRNATLAHLFSEQKHWLEQILHYETLKADEIKKRDLLAKTVSEIDDLRTKAEGVAKELTSHQAEIERLEAGAAKLEADIAARNPEKLEQILEKARNLEDQAAALERNNVALRALQTEVNRILNERAEAVQESEAIQRLAAEIDSRLPALEAATAEAERAWRTAVSSRQPNVEELRSQLSPGRPCPVCGALDHPWASAQAPALDELVEKSAKRHEELEKELAAMRRKRLEHEARLEALQKSIRQADKRLNSLAPERERLRAIILQGVRQLKLKDANEAERALAAAKSRFESASKELRLIRDQEAVLRDTVRQSKSRKRVFEKLSGVHQKLQTDLTVALSRQESIATQLAEIDETRGRLRKELDSAFSPWMALESAEPGRSLAMLDDDPVTLRRLFASRADEWKKNLEKLEETRRSISAVEAEVEYREREKAQAEAEYFRADTGFLSRKREANELTRKRGLILQGRPVAEVREIYDGEVETARNRLEEAERTLEAAATELTRVEMTIGSQVEQLRINSENLRARRAALEKELSKHHLTEKEARELAARGEAWCSSTREAINEYDTERVRVRERVEERERRLAEHERSRPDRSCEEVERLLNETREKRKSTDELRGELCARLIHAQSLKDRMNSLSERLLVVEEEGRVWRELGEVIGSADGKTFRNFAQTYTLELLLEHANRHLADLKPRYRLERLRDDDHDPLGIVVVDQDMGDDRRSVNTLSGGETFLVSLALALGLSSLQSHRVRLGSLFIDEGFGALDAAALETALSALEALQLQDRQIGIISHVEGLAEHFPAEVRVVPLGAGASRVEVVQRWAIGG
ncbi:MAG TPA: AAA family ATPase [Acidobacteriota bacterium]|nr:AAA family ATPase [Acidobacteriota bacterium]